MWELFFSVLRYAAPVGFASIGETLGQKAGLLNIGLEGMMLVAAYAATVGSESSGSPWVGLAIGVAAALSMGVVQAAFVVHLRADQVVAGTAFNLLAMGLTSTLFRARYGQTGQLMSIPTIPKTEIGFDAMIALLLVSAVLVSWFLVRTRAGLALRAVGEYPDALAAAGFSPNRLRWLAAMVGAVFAGLGGSYLALGIAGSFAANMTAGRGFVAIAMVTFGRWRPLGVLAAAVLIGATESLQYLMQARSSAIPSEILKALPYLVALAVLAFVGKGTRAPAKLGEV